MALNLIDLVKKESQIRKDFAKEQYLKEQQIEKQIEAKELFEKKLDEKLNAIKETITSTQNNELTPPAPKKPNTLMYAGIGVGVLVLGYFGYRLMKK